MSDASRKTVEVTEDELAQLREFRRRAEEKSGRMSLRIPHDLYRLLAQHSAKTKKPKSEVVVEALRSVLAARKPVKSGLFD